jgi:glycogen debranching enzyme
VDQLSNSVLLLTRHNPENHKSVLLIAHTSFFQPNDKWDHINSLSIQGVIDEIILEASLHHPYDQEPIKNFQRSKEYINGLEHTKVYLNENILIEKSACVRLTSPNSPDYTGFHTIEFTENFRPGSVVVLQVSLLPQIRQSIINIQQLINQFSNPTSQFNQIIKELTLVDLERILYRSSLEEQADGKGFDVYSIHDYGKLIFCGIQGIISILEKIRLQNELKHPLVINLKQGNWLMDYTANRLKAHTNTKQVCFIQYQLNKNEITNNFS